MGIFLVDPEKGVPQQISEAASGLQPFPACTPDGRWLFYTSGRDLMKVSTAGGAPVLFGTQIHEGRVSPDGRLIAVHKVVTPGKEAFEIREVADASLVRVLPGPESNGYQWTPDGAALIGRTTSGDGIPNFERIPIDGSARSVITHFTSTDYLFVLAINPDGRVAFSRGTSDTDVVLLTAR
jgi:Tol biopolymer transport system component